MTAAPIGTVLFTDGHDRPVFEDEPGQFVIDDDGARVEGVWIWIPEPDVVPRKGGNEQRS